MLSGATPVSRKTLRRLNAALDNASTANHSDFTQLAKEFFDAVEKAVEPMKQKNPGMMVTRLENGLNIELAEGKVGVFGHLALLLLCLCLHFMDSA
jgi:hypothetical protein